MVDTAGENILIVESDILIRHPLAEYLRECGYKVFEAAGVTEARKLLSDGKFRFDILLADVDADNELAFGLAQWIRNEYPDIDVILAGTVEKAAQKAGNLCEEGPAVTKPYEHQLVLSRIKQSLAARGRASKPER